MEVMFRNKNTTEEYVLNIPTIKVNNNEELEYFISSNFISEYNLVYIYNQMVDPKFSEEYFLECMLNPLTIQLIIWSSCIAPYAYQHSFPCPMWSRENDMIWEKLIEFGLVELRNT